MAKETDEERLTRSKEAGARKSRNLARGIDTSIAGSPLRSLDLHPTFHAVLNQEGFCTIEDLKQEIEERGVDWLLKLPSTGEKRVASLVHRLLGSESVLLFSTDPDWLGCYSRIKELLFSTDPDWIGCYSRIKELSA